MKAPNGRGLKLVGQWDPGPTGHTLYPALSIYIYNKTPKGIRKSSGLLARTPNVDGMQANDTFEEKAVNYCHFLVHHKSLIHRRQSFSKEVRVNRRKAILVLLLVMNSIINNKLIFTI